VSSEKPKHLDQISLCREFHHVGMWFTTGIGRSLSPSSRKHPSQSRLGAQPPVTRIPQFHLRGHILAVWGQKRAPPSARNFKCTKAFVWRLTLALAGGFALVISMLTMKLVPTTLTVGLTTTLFVLAAAVLLSLYSKSDVLTLTAAYAAVLVVLVGTSTTQGGSDNGAQWSCRYCYGVGLRGYFRCNWQWCGMLLVKI
jgi:hypothetical protein